MARPLRVLLAGEEAAGAQTLRLLHETGQQVVGVLTGRADAERSSGPLASLAAPWGFRVWPARRVREPAFADEIRAECVELLLNVHSLYVVKKEHGRDRVFFGLRYHHAYRLDLVNRCVG